jgi:DNA-binding transcriptional MerR regulator
MQEKKYNIGQLAELSGFSRRTIRFYVQSGLLNPPAGAGRGHYYTDAHLEALQKINSLKDNNLSLDEIVAALHAPDVAVEEALPVPTTWVRLEVCPGIELQVQGGRYPVTPARIRRLQKFIQQLFGTNTNQREVSDEE